MVLLGSASVRSPRHRQDNDRKGNRFTVESKFLQRVRKLANKQVGGRGRKVGESSVYSCENTSARYVSTHLSLKRGNKGVGTSMCVRKLANSSVLR